MGSEHDFHVLFIISQVVVQACEQFREIKWSEERVSI